MDVASNLLKEANTLAWQPVGEEVSIILYFRPDVKNTFYALMFSLFDVYKIIYTIISNTN